MAQPEQQNNLPTPEVINPDNIGLYARLALATQPNAEIERLTDPAKPVTETDMQGFDINAPRDYTAVTEKLSTFERTEAWKGKDFETAYREWRQSAAAAIQAGIADSGNKLAFVQILQPGITKGFTATDSDRLYQTYCDGKSDTTLLVKDIIESVSVDGKVDVAKLDELLPQARWFLEMFLGELATIAVCHSLVLEAELINNSKAKETLFGDLGRINRPVDKESLILFAISSGGYGTKDEAAATPPAEAEEKAQAEAPEDKSPKVAVNPAPLVAEKPQAAADETAANTNPTQITAKEKYENALKELGEVRKIQDALSRGEVPVNPTTGLPFASIDEARRFFDENYPRLLDAFTIARDEFLAATSSKPSAIKAAVTTPAQPEPAETPEENSNEIDLGAATMLLGEGHTIINSETGRPFENYEKMKQHILEGKTWDVIRRTAAEPAQPGQAADEIPAGTFMDSEATPAPQTPEIVYLESSEDFPEIEINRHLSGETSTNKTFGINATSLRYFLAYIPGFEPKDPGEVRYNADNKNQIELRNIQVVAEDVNVGGDITLGIVFSNLEDGNGIKAQVIEYNGIERSKVESQLQTFQPNFLGTINNLLTHQNPNWSAINARIEIQNDVPRIIINYQKLAPGENQTT